MKKDILENSISEIDKKANISGKQNFYAYLPCYIQNKGKSFFSRTSHHFWSDSHRWFVESDKFFPKSFAKGGADESPAPLGFFKDKFIHNQRE